MEAIRVLLCNHHPLVRTSLRILLENAPGIRLVGETADAYEALMLTEYGQPDVVLLDMKLAQKSGISTAREISAKTNRVGIVFVSFYADEQYVAEAFKAGARGYVMAESVPNDLIESIRIVAAGGRFVSRGLVWPANDGFSAQH